MPLGSALVVPLASIHRSWHRYRAVEVEFLPTSMFLRLEHRSPEELDFDGTHTRSLRCHLPWTNDPFSQLRFRGGPDAASTDAETAHEVVTMRWVGGEFLTGTGAAFNTDSEIEHAFDDDSLEWMLGP